MATKTVNDLAIRLALELAGCPRALILDRLREGCRELLLRTHPWQVDLTMDLVEDQEEYTLDVSATHADAVVEHVVLVKVNGTVYPARLWRTTVDGELGFESSWVPGEDVTDGLVVRVSLGLADDATTFPDWLIDRYGYAIRGYAGMNLCRIAKRPWSDMQAGEVFGREYRRGLSRLSAWARDHADPEDAGAWDRGGIGA
jgi:hypothetical protein